MVPALPQHLIREFLELPDRVQRNVAIRLGGVPFVEMARSKADTVRAAQFCMKLASLLGHELNAFLKLAIDLVEDVVTPQLYQALQDARRKFSETDVPLNVKIALATWVIQVEQNVDSVMTASVSDLVGAYEVPTTNISSNVNQMFETKTKRPLIERVGFDSDEEKEKRFRLTSAGRSMITNLLGV